MTALIFLVLGMILLSPELLAAWTTQRLQRRHVARHDDSGAAVADPDHDFPRGADIHVHQRQVGERREYRTRFFDPLIDDVRLTLTARNRYRAAVAAS